MRKHLQTEAGECWLLLSYVHTVVYITIQLDGGGGPGVADLGWRTWGGGPGVVDLRWT